MPRLRLGPVRAHDGRMNPTPVNWIVSTRAERTRRPAPTRLRCPGPRREIALEALQDDLLVIGAVGVGDAHKGCRNGPRTPEKRVVRSGSVAAQQMPAGPPQRTKQRRRDLPVPVPNTDTGDAHPRRSTPGLRRRCGRTWRPGGLGSSSGITSPGFHRGTAGRLLRGTTRRLTGQALLTLPVHSR